MAACCSALRSRAQGREWSEASAVTGARSGCREQKGRPLALVSACQGIEQPSTRVLWGKAAVTDSGKRPGGKHAQQQESIV